MRNILCLYVVLILLREKKHKKIEFLVTVGKLGETRPIVTRQYPDIDSDGKEEIEVLMQGSKRMCRLQRVD